MEYSVNDQKFSYHAEGSVMLGDNHIMLDRDDDLTAGMEWWEAGYTIQPLFETSLFDDFLKNTKVLLLSLWRKAGLSIPDSFLISDYHTIAQTQQPHLKAVELTKLIGVQDFPVPISKLENKISKIIGKEVIVRNPFDGLSVFHFRVIRPNKNDNNPLHRDVWLEDYKDCINLYIPITGSNEKSSLIIAPGSHRWPESQVERTTSGAMINGVKFNVPAVTRLLTSSKFTRPNPEANEVLIFSPYLIHGGSSNLNEDVTRISIEVRLWRR